MSRLSAVRSFGRRAVAAGGTLVLVGLTACTSGGEAAQEAPATIPFQVTDALTTPTSFVETTPPWFACDDDNFFASGLSATTIAVASGLEPTAVERDEIVGTGPSCIVGNRLVVVLNRAETYENSKALNLEGAVELTIGGHPAFARAQALQIGHPDGLLQFVLTGGDADLLPQVAAQVVAAIDGTN